ncbi:anti-muellerian hormone type-2 receptor [Wolffia australiana]
MATAGAALSLLSPAAPPRRRPCPPPRRAVVCQAKGSQSNGEGGADGLQLAAAVGGLVANPVIGYSLYTLKTTGCGLPPGPGGLLGGLEGVSYLVVAAIVGWSAYTKVKTGSGLPNGPFGLLGAVEGVSYLTVVAIAVVFGLQVFDRGYLPGPLPGEQCFG